MAARRRDHRNLANMRLAIATVLVLGPWVALAEETPPKLTLYKTASAAACSGDDTVWVDPAARTYYVKGEKLYGKTGAGGYNCRRQADAAGYRRAGAR
jgi:hypothetical protein